MGHWVCECVKKGTTLRLFLSQMYQNSFFFDLDSRELRANCLIVVILVHGPVSWPGLGTTGPLGHDDLIDAKDCACCVGGVTHGPVLEHQQVVDLAIGRVDGQTGALNFRVFLENKK